MISQPFLAQDFGSYRLPRAKLGLRDALALYDALGTLVAVMDGLLCQPRFGGHCTDSPAASVIARLRDQFEGLREEAAGDIERGHAADRFDRMERASVMVQRAMEGGEDFEEALALVADFSATRS